MDNCTSGCKARDHESYAECLRSNTPSVRNSTQSVDAMYRRELVNYTEITEYKAARAQGIQPRGSKLHQIREAVAASQQADKPLKMA